MCDGRKLRALDIFVPYSVCSKGGCHVWLQAGHDQDGTWAYPWLPRSSVKCDPLGWTTPTPNTGCTPLTLAHRVRAKSDEHCEQKEIRWMTVPLAGWEWVYSFCSRLLRKTKTAHRFSLQGPVLIVSLFFHGASL